jgi:ribosomal protein S18 acetylase RimI-like enzyme
MKSSTRARIDQHLITARIVNYRNVQGGLLEVMPHWNRGFSGLQLPLFNVFVPLDSAGLSDETLADTAAFFSSRNVYYVIELVHDKFPNGPDFLNQRRYQSLPPQPAMILKGSPNTVGLNPDLVIERVTTVPSLTGFCTIMNAVFDLSLPDLVKLFPARHFEDDRIQHYLAFLDEQPVGGGTTILADGVASIWNVCTLDQYRRQGVASALLRRMLADTSEFGSDFTILYSTAQAYQLFNNFGFEIFTQRQWFLPPGIDYEE